VVVLTTGVPAIVAFAVIVAVPARDPDVRVAVPDPAVVVTLVGEMVPRVELRVIAVPSATGVPSAFLKLVEIVDVVLPSAVIVVGLAVT